MLTKHTMNMTSFNKIKGKACMKMLIKLEWLYNGNSRIESEGLCNGSMEIMHLV